MASITRGTTPSVTVRVPMDLTDYTCYLSFGEERKPWITADNSQMEAEYGQEESVLVFTLTQKQTLALKSASALVQLRLIKDDVALATNMAMVDVGDIIQGGVIEDAY